MEIKAYCITWAGLTLIKLFFKLVEILKKKKVNCNKYAQKIGKKNSEK
jgi:hypothetical protein